MTDRKLADVHLPDGITTEDVPVLSEARESTHGLFQRREYDTTLAYQCPKGHIVPIEVNHEAVSDFPAAVSAKCQPCSNARHGMMRNLVSKRCLWDPDSVTIKCGNHHCGYETVVFEYDGEAWDCPECGGKLALKDAESPLGEPVDEFEWE